MIHSIQIFPWNENFATGIDTIDEQHKQLISLINQLAVHVAVHAGEALLQKIFNELADYVEYHFRTEEQIMVACYGNDPDAVTHLHAHHSFEDKVKALQSGLQEKPWREVMEETLSFLVHWLVLHILDTDKRMAKTVLASQQGASFAEARQQADKEMAGMETVLIGTILTMYGDLSSKALQLMKEIAERKKAEQRLQLVAKAIENTLEAIFITNVEGELVDVNPSFCAIAERDVESVIGENIQSLHSFLSEDSNIWNEVEEHGHWAGETHNKNQHGETVTEWLNLSAIKNEHGETTNYVGVFSNVSQLMDRQKDLHHIANHDALTALPNRMLLRDRLAQEVKNNQRQAGKVLAVLFIDLDGFKAVNDTFGHDAGDAVLVQTAQRFAQCLRASDTVARLGGDEFVILLPHLSNNADCKPMLERLLQSVAQPVLFDSHALNVTLSIGVAVCPENSDNVDELLLLADRAMYKAKRAGKNRYIFVEPC